MNPRGILISPGPGKNFLDVLFLIIDSQGLTKWGKGNYSHQDLYRPFFLLIGEPQDSGISLQTVLELGPTVPLFGVCMGLQCIGEAFGGESS